MNDDTLGSEVCIEVWGKRRDNPRRALVSRREAIMSCERQDVVSRGVKC
jgi:hypothetical protein